MLNSKQRSNLRAIAAGVSPSTQLGKGGISPTFLQQISDYLECHELVKITVLRNADFTAKEMVNKLADLLGAEAVCAIGNKIILYRRSSRDNVAHLLF